MICNTNGCGCGIKSTTLTITGSGTSADPWVIEMAGDSDITQLQADVANIFATLAGLDAAYVNTTGDSMSGALSITAAVEALQIRRTSDGAHIGWYGTDGTRLLFIQAIQASGIVNVAAAAGMAMAFQTNAAEAARILTSGTFLYGKTASNIATAGVENNPGGFVLITNVSTTNGVQINKIGAGIASGTVFEVFQIGGSTIGTISRNAATSAVLYNLSSDERLKNAIGELDGELAEYVLDLVKPMMFSWKDDKGNTPIAGYIAQQVAKAWPQSIELGLVTPGYGDITDRTWDSDGNETTPEGVWGPWQMAPMALIPLLHASLARTTWKLGNLRAEFDDLKVEHDDLKARVAKLEGA